MGRELEVKYVLPEEEALAKALAGPLLAPFLEEGEPLSMDALYYDTDTLSLAGRRWGLRLRKEGEKSVCCLKLAGETGRPGLFSRGEYEAEAETLADGLSALAAAGAPEEAVRMLSQAALRPVCRIVFTRRIWQYRRGGLACELAADRGHIEAGGKTAPIRELELELKSGSAEDFIALSQMLEQTLSLRPISEGKLQRALRLVCPEGF